MESFEVAVIKLRVQGILRYIYIYRDGEHVFYLKYGLNCEVFGQNVFVRYYHRNEVIGN